MSAYSKIIKAMKQRLFKYIATTLLFGCTISCSQEDVAPNKTSKTPILFNVNICSLPDTQVSTRSSNSNGSSISVSPIEGSSWITRGASGSDGKNYAFALNDLVSINIGSVTKSYKVSTVATGGLTYNGSAADAFFWSSASESKTICAWSYGSPSSTTADGTTSVTADPHNQTYTLPTDQSADYKELLYSKAGSYSYGSVGSVPIQLYHQLSRVVINLSHTSTGSLSVSTIRIGDGSTAVIPTTATFNKPTSGNTGTWTSIGEQKGQITPKTETANSCYSAVLIPTTYAANTKFIVITTAAGTFAYYLSSAISLQAGYQYTFDISVKDLVQVSDEITIGSISSYTYDGSAKEPHPTVTYGSKTLTEGTHYDLSWSNNTNAGTATCTVTGKGVFSGTKSNTFIINRAAGAITNLSRTNLTLSNSTTSGSVTVTRNGDGAVTATSSDTFVATVSVSGNVVTITTINDGSATITIKVNQGTNYTAYTGTDKTVSVTSSGFREVKMNPLWYVATYNMASSTAMATTDDAGYHFDWSHAMSYFAAQNTSYSNYRNANKTFGGVKYHLPVKGECFSIMPATTEASDLFRMSSTSGTYKSSNQTVIFGYNDATKAGISEAAYWKKASATEVHAIRFLGTYYCSAWKYELLGSFTSSSKGYLRVSATLIGKVGNSEAAAKAWYDANWNSVTWGNDDSKFAQQRKFYGRGYKAGTQDASGDNVVGEKGYFWAATQSETQSDRAWNMNFYSQSGNRSIYVDFTDGKDHGFNVRLFKDN